MSVRLSSRLGTVLTVLTLWLVISPAILGAQQRIHSTDPEVRLQMYEDMRP